jgi:hypothetical protein
VIELTSADDEVLLRVVLDRTRHDQPCVMLEFPSGAVAYDWSGLARERIRKLLVMGGES